MEQMDKRNRTKDVLIFSFLTIILISLICINGYYINLYNEEKELNNEYKTTLENKKLELNNLNNSNDKINNEISFYKNIDNEVIEIKKKYYDTLKVFESKVLNGDVNYKIAYLTFDDGPYYLTHSVLKILEENNVRATFFTIGLDKEYCYDNRSMYCVDIYSKIHNSGHTLANHTYTHQIFNGLYSSSDRFIWDVKKQEELIKNKTGHTTNIVRFPGGSASAKYLKDEIINKLKENGYGWTDWTCMNGDGGYVPNAETAFNNFKNGIDENVEVILLHDYSYMTVSILPDIIKYLKDNNYVMLPLFYESKMVNK